MRISAQYVRIVRIGHSYVLGSNKWLTTNCKPENTDLTKEKQCNITFAMLPFYQKKYPKIAILSRLEAKGYIIIDATIRCAASWDVWKLRAISWLMQPSYVLYTESFGSYWGLYHHWCNHQMCCIVSRLEAKGYIIIYATLRCAASWDVWKLRAISSLMQPSDVLHTESFGSKGLYYHWCNLQMCCILSRLEAKGYIIIDATLRCATSWVVWKLRAISSLMQPSDVLHTESFGS